MVELTLIPVHVQEIQEEQASLFITEKDVCSSCRNLHYCPGKQSICSLVLYGKSESWPCTFDAEHRAARPCPSFEVIQFTGENCVI